MPKHWALICPDHDEPGLWNRWRADQCVAVGWTPQRYQLRGPTDERDWETTRNYLLEMTPGDVIIPYLCNWRFGTPAEIERMRVGDDQWSPTVSVRHYGLAARHGEPGLGRRIMVNWPHGAVPPPGRIARVPIDIRKNNPHGMISKTIVPVNPNRLALFMGIINDPANWEDYSPS